MAGLTIHCKIYLRSCNILAGYAWPRRFRLQTQTDEERLFDRSKSRTCAVVERESDMEAVARAYA